MGAGPFGLKNVLFALILAIATPLTALHADASTPRHKRPASRHAVSYHQHVREAPKHHYAVHRGLIHRPYVLVHPEYEHQAIGHHILRLDVARYGAFDTEVRHNVSFRHGIARRMGRAYRRVARGGMSCVPFARRASGINLVGNAWQWWDLAAGIYARGSVPQMGSVLAFRANPHMRLGHVAVVVRVVNRREIEIDQANWYRMRGAVSVDVPVVDVSEANDWTAVRVGLGDGVKFGAVYPTYGFIYDRPDTGTITAAAVTAPAPQPQLNPAPRDLRPVVERPWATYEEVAEAPENPTGDRSVIQAANPRRVVDGTGRQ